MEIWVFFAYLFFIETCHTATPEIPRLVFILETDDAEVRDEGIEKARWERIEVQGKQCERALRHRETNVGEH